MREEQPENLAACEGLGPGTSKNPPGEVEHVTRHHVLAKFAHSNLFLLHCFHFPEIVMFGFAKLFFKVEQKKRNWKLKSPGSTSIWA